MYSPPIEMPGMILKYMHALGSRGTLPRAEPVGSVDAEHKILSIIQERDGPRFLPVQEKHH